jgi:HPt (histidine-containing phosphotransfer) domain-containing protein
MIDQSRIHALIKDYPDLLLDLYDVFRTAGIRRLDEMRYALTKNDLNEFYRLAHAFKTSGAQIGAVDVEEESRNLEFLCKTGQVAQLWRELDQLKSLFEQDVYELDRMLHRH